LITGFATWNALEKPYGKASTLPSARRTAAPAPAGGEKAGETLRLMHPCL
jgi:hypothetical protein